MNLKNFVICGLTGWCMEILFTAFGALLRGNSLMVGYTSLWMFPIYGMAVLIYPVYRKIHRLPLLLRGCLYAAIIMVGEFVSGSILRFFGVCPWNYAGTPNNINGLVRLDYFPVWILAGILFERLLCYENRERSKVIHKHEKQSN